LANPVLWSVSAIAAVLLITGVPYPTYFSGAQFIHFLLGPAVVALGWTARGFALGTAAHGIGAARAAGECRRGSLCRFGAGPAGGAGIAADATDISVVGLKHALLATAGLKSKIGTYTYFPTAISAAHGAPCALHVRRNQLCSVSVAAMWQAVAFNHFSDNREKDNCQAWGTSKQTPQF
jgi:hypothetical protein